ncbi:Sperm flagellar protein 2 (Protein KPL2) [Durusdinium trenchii]|uniref:Sperm flagellar protein 2 (Protein KPL2) n=1 Tax=Durusdinium trenchii TaxID=1381693 RepID=A0ABP0SQC9_9DINO
MSRLLRDWLNNEVCLTRKVSHEFGKELSNGFLLGELLYRFNQQGDFAEFRDSERLACKVDNFVRLERTLTRLGVKGFDSRTALSIMNGCDDKACVDLLYKIKMTLQSIKVVVGRHPEALMPGNFLALSDLPQRTTKPEYDAAKSTIFEQSVRMRMQSQNQVDMHKHLTPFYEEKQRQDMHIELMKQEDRDDREMYYYELRQRRMLNKQGELEYLNAWHEKGIGIWTENQRRRKYVNDVQDRHERKIATSAAERKQRLLLNSQEDASTGIVEMDGRVEYFAHEQAMIRSGTKDSNNRSRSRLSSVAGSTTPDALMQQEQKVAQEGQRGLDDDDDGGGGDDQLADYMALLDQEPRRTEAPSTTDTVGRLIKAQSSKIPGVSAQAVSDFISQLRTRKGTQEAFRERRESRRVRFLNHLHEDVVQNLEQTKIRVLQECIQTTCQAEDDLREQLQQQDKLEQVFRENRDFRDQQYKQEEDVEAQRSLNKALLQDEHQALKVKREQEWFRRHLERIENSVHEARGQQARFMCEEITRGIVDLVLKRVDHTVVTQNGAPLQEVLMEHTVEFVEGSHADVELSDYLEFRRSWAVTDPEDAVPVPRAVGNLLNCLRVHVSPTPQPRAPAASLRRFAVQIAITGMPLAGKSTLAWRLAARHGLRIIRPEQALSANTKHRDLRKPASDQDIVDAVVQAIRGVVEESKRIDAKIAERATPTEAGSNETQSELAAAFKQWARPALLKKLFDLWDLDESGELDPQELLIATMTAHCEGKSRLEVEEEAMCAFNQMDFDLNGSISWDEFTTYFETVFGQDSCDQVARNLLLKTTATLQPIRGWVLDGFPETRSQAKLLELALGGKDVDEVEFQPVPALSLPCDPPLPLPASSFRDLEAGALDAVLDLQISPEVSFARAAELGLQRTSRFRVAPEVHSVALHKEQISSWYSHFGVFHPIQGQVDQDEVFAAASDPVEDVLARKAHHQAELDRLEQERCHLAACQRVCDEWEAAMSDRDVVCAVPPLSVASLKAAELCDPSVDEGKVVTAELCKEILKVHPDEACEKSATFRSSDAGKMIGVASSWMSSLSQNDVEFSAAQLKEWFAQAFPAPDDVDGAETGQDEAELEAESLASFLQRYLSRVQIQGEEDENEEREAKNEAPEEENSAIDEPPQAGEEATARRQACQRQKETVLEKAIEIIQADVDDKLSARKKEIEEATKKAAKSKNKAANGSPRDEETVNAEGKQIVIRDIRQLEQKVAKRVLRLVDSHDKTFVEQSKLVFKQRRELRDEWLAHFAEEQVDLDRMLCDCAADLPKQAKLTDFQLGFDSLEDSIRFDPMTKVELHQRVEDLTKELWEVIQIRRDDVLDKISQLKSAPWLEDFLACDADTFLHLMQLETTRYQAVRGALVLLACAQKNLPSTDGDASATVEFPSDARDLYAELWPVAHLFGESRDPELSFDPANVDSAPGKKRGKKDKAPATEDDGDESSVPKCDPRIEIGVKAALSFQNKAQLNDSSIFEGITNLAEAVAALDAAFAASVSRLGAKAASAFQGFREAADRFRLSHVNNCDERFDGEITAMEALVLYCSKRIEQARSLEKRLVLKGTSFLLDGTFEMPQRTPDQDGNESHEET